MLTRIVVKIYGALLEISLWFLLIVGLVAGYNFGFYSFYDYGMAYIFAVVGGILALVVAAVLVGAFLVLEDIRKSVRRLEKHIAGEGKNAATPASHAAEAASRAAFHQRQGVEEAKAAHSASAPSAPAENAATPQPHRPVPRAPRPGQKL